MVQLNAILADIHSPKNPHLHTVIRNAARTVPVKISSQFKYFLANVVADFVNSLRVKLITLTQTKHKIVKFDDIGTTMRMWAV